MDKSRNRLLVALGSVAAVGLLLAAFMVVWLMPRGPETGSASGPSAPAPAVGNTGGVSIGSKTDMAPISSGSYGQTGAPSMAQAIDQPHIGVRGNGVVSAKPDMAIIQVGVQIQNTSLDAAQSEAAAKMDAVMNQLKTSGVAEQDIATSQYSVDPVMDYRDNEPPRVTGFRVTNVVSAKIRDISKAGDTIDALIKSGANTLYGVSFTFSDPSALMRQAREQAVKDARAKAEQLATLTGVSLGTVIVVEDGGSNTTPPPVPMMEAAGRDMAQAANTPISPGQQEIRVDVSVVFGIK
jgi:hypothetical protein